MRGLPTEKFENMANTYSFNVNFFNSDKFYSWFTLYLIIYFAKWTAFTVLKSIHHLASKHRKYNSSIEGKNAY